MLWHKPNTEAQGIAYFLEVMHAPQNRNLSDWFIEGRAELDRTAPRTIA